VSSHTYFQCAYCPKWVGEHGKKVPRTIGHYRVKIIADYILIFRCDRCLNSFRVTMLGGILRWADMTQAERLAFRRKGWKKPK